MNTTRTHAIINNNTKPDRFSMSRIQRSSLNFLCICIIILFAVFLIKINRNVRDLRFQVLRLSQRLADVIAQQELSTPKSDSHSEPLHTCTDISLTNFSLNERKSYTGGNAEATNGNIVNDRDYIASSDVPSPGVEPGKGRVQTFGFYQSVHENQLVLEGHGYSKNSIESKTCRVPIATAIRSSVALRSSNLPPATQITSTTLPTLAILVRRLGLFWKTFDPIHGIFLAEGNHQSLESVPSADPSAIYVHYSISALSSSPSLTSNEYLAIPTPQATHFLFGTIPPYPPLSIPAISIHSISAIHEVANKLDPSGRMSQKIHDVRSFMPSCTLGFSDIIPFAAPMMRARGTALTRVPSPSQYTGGLTRHRDGFRIFRLRLGQYLHERGGTERMEWVRETYDELLTTFPAEWETEIQPMNSINSPSRIPFLDQCQDVWDQCTSYFVDLNAVNPIAPAELVCVLASPSTLTPPGFTYYGLMAAHLKHAVGYWGDAWKRIKEGIAREALGGHDWIAEGAHCYWDYLPRIVATLREGTALTEGRPDNEAADDEASAGEELDGDERSPIKATVVHEAWTVMMLRASCWWRCHWTDQDWLGDEEGRVDPQYLDDGAGMGDGRRVYIF